MIPVSYSAKPEIGKVILASGRRMTGQQRLDRAALIETPRTFTANKPTPSHAIYGSAALNLPFDVDYFPNDSKVRDVATFKSHNIVFKTGRTSRYTLGIVNGMRRDIN
jgi:hypothetical protein